MYRYTVRVKKGFLYSEPITAASSMHGSEYKSVYRCEYFIEVTAKDMHHAYLQAGEITFHDEPDYMEIVHIRGWG
jgi:hypothetical protein